MKYLETIEKAITYIKKNVEEQLTLNELAKHVGYSQYHFLRIFSEVMGVSPMEYVRIEKLNYAALDLFKGSKIIDIAIKYGYETASGFSKSFKKEFGFTPTKYISHMARLNARNIYISDGRDKMEPKIVNKDEFSIVGYGIETNINSDNFTKEIAAFWSQYDTYGWENTLYEKLNPPKHGEFGISISDEWGNLKYVLGVATEDLAKSESDMLTIKVPRAKYAVFTTPAVDYSRSRGIAGKIEFEKSIKDTWKYIFETWFRRSNYQYDDSKMDFEYYDERCHYRKDTVMEIYVPIKER